MLFTEVKIRSRCLKYFRRTVIISEHRAHHSINDFFEDKDFVAVIVTHYIFCCWTSFIITDCFWELSVHWFLMLDASEITCEMFLMVLMSQ
jgi:hypothetical protein